MRSGQRTILIMSSLILAASLSGCGSDLPTMQSGHEYVHWDSCKGKPIGALATDWSDEIFCLSDPQAKALCSRTEGVMRGFHSGRANNMSWGSDKSSAFRNGDIEDLDTSWEGNKCSLYIRVRWTTGRFEEVMTVGTWVKDRDGSIAIAAAQ